MVENRTAADPRANREFLSDVTWGQFCLFLFIRIQDDLFDGQAGSPSMLFGADQFLIEGERAFGRHLAASSRFWSFFHDCLEGTTRAIIHVDTLQRTPRGRLPELLAAYAEVASVFKLGLAAICLRYRRERDFEILQEFADEVAMADQIVDDLEDVAEDLQRGRFNFVAKVVIGSAHGVPAGTGQLGSRRIVEQLWRSETIPVVLDESRRHLQRALEVARELGNDAAVTYASSAQAALRRLRAALHRRRVELLLRSLLDHRRRP